MPYPDFPLTPHPPGKRCKKIKGTGQSKASVGSLSSRTSSTVQRSTTSCVPGTAGDGLKHALVLLHECRGECPNAELVLAVHDELVVEVPEAETEAPGNRRCKGDRG
jgi:hypothetical protein